MSPPATFEIEVDASLTFVFASDWRAEKWDTTDSYQARRATGRKDTDLVAARDRALVVEVKDDRVHAGGPGSLKFRPVATFVPEIATKFRHTVEDALEAGEKRESSLVALFHKRWFEEKRRLVLWWERGPRPPSGAGTPDDRWKVHFSAIGNKLEAEVGSELSRHVAVCSRLTEEGPDDGITVKSFAPGVGARRRSTRAAKGPGKAERSKNASKPSSERTMKRGKQR